MMWCCLKYPYVPFSGFQCQLIFCILVSSLFLVYPFITALSCCCLDWAVNASSGYLTDVLSSGKSWSSNFLFLLNLMWLFLELYVVQSSGFKKRAIIRRIVFPHPDEICRSGDCFCFINLRNNIHHVVEGVGVGSVGFELSVAWRHSLHVSFSLIQLGAPPLLLLRCIACYSPNSFLDLFTKFLFGLIHEIPVWSYSWKSDLELFTKFLVEVIQEIPVWN